jgi:hypothetical protein
VEAVMADEKHRNAMAALALVKRGIEEGRRDAQAEIAKYRAALVGMVLHESPRMYGPDGLTEARCSGDIPHVVAAFAALGIPDPCPAEEFERLTGEGR